MEDVIVVAVVVVVVVVVVVIVVAVVVMTSHSAGNNDTGGFTGATATHRSVGHCRAGYAMQGTAPADTHNLSPP